MRPVKSPRTRGTTQRPWSTASLSGISAIPMRSRKSEICIIKALEWNQGRCKFRPFSVPRSKSAEKSAPFFVTSLLDAGSIQLTVKIWVSAKQEEMPQILYIFSDMGFHCCMRNAVRTV